LPASAATTNSGCMDATMSGTATVSRIPPHSCWPAFSRQLLLQSHKWMFTN
jgi:hypothetical protein